MTLLSSLDTEELRLKSLNRLGRRHYWWPGLLAHGQGCGFT